MGAKRDKLEEKNTAMTGIQDAEQERSPDAVCPSCDDGVLRDGRCDLCGYIDVSEDIPPASLWAREKFRFDPATHSRVYEKRWLFSTVSLSVLICAGAFIGYFHRDLWRNLVVGGADRIFSVVLLSLCGYPALAALLNRTRISVSPARLIISRGPIPVPFLGKLDLPVDRIKGIEVVREEAVGSKNATVYFNVVAVTDKDRHTVISFTESRLPFSLGMRADEQAKNLGAFLRKTLQVKKASKPERRKGEADTEASVAFVFLFIGILLLDSLILKLTDSPDWQFDRLFLFGMVVAAAFSFWVLWFLHHRKKERLPNAPVPVPERPRPWVANYILSVLILTVVCIPVVMGVTALIRLLF